MSITIHRNNNPDTLRLEGGFSHSDEPIFRAAYMDLLRDPSLLQIKLDCSSLSHLDSSALGMMLVLREQAVAVQKQVVLQNPTPFVAKTLRTVGFAKLFQIQGGLV